MLIKSSSIKMSSRRSTTTDVTREQGRPAPVVSLLLLPLVVSMALLSSCRQETVIDGATPLVVVDGNVLYWDDVEGLVPETASSEDSAHFVEEYVRTWAEEVLFYEKAKSNVSDAGLIDRLVEDYRKNLIINYYQNNLIEENADMLIPDDSVKARYDGSRESYRLERSAAKGVFMKLRKGTPDIRTAKRLIGNDARRDELERLSLKQAAGYLYFRNQWMGLDAVGERSPFGERLETSQSINGLMQTEDSSYVYLLYVDSFLPKGSVMPYELAEDEIRESMRNEQKVAFIRSVKEDLYNSALERGRVKYPDRHE